VKQDIAAHDLIVRLDVQKRSTSEVEVR